MDFVFGTLLNLLFICIRKPLPLPNHPKFRASKTTRSYGLSIRWPGSNRENPFDMDARAFDQTAYAMHGLKRLSYEHPEVDHSLLCCFVISIH